MEVLVLGLPRTATQSLAEALTILGYPKVYHMREVAKNGHQKYWIQALEAKYDGKGKEYGKKEFDGFLSDFQGIADYPGAIFPAELIAAYPNAKVILTIRDEDKWYDSMMATIWHQWNSEAGKLNPSPMRALADKYQQCVWKGDFPSNGREQFREHNEFVRNLAPKDRFLDWDVKEGWGPLCAFLEKGIPAMPFPRADDWAEYKKVHAVKAFKQAFAKTKLLETTLNGGCPTWW